MTLIDWDQIKQMFPSVWNEFHMNENFEKSKMAAKMADML